MRNMTSAAPDDPHLLRAALDYSSDAIILFECLRDRFGNIQALKAILANQKVAELIGQSADLIVSQTAHALFPEALAVAIWEQAVAVVTTGQISDTEISVTSNAGCTSWLYMLVSRHGDGVAVSLRDITEAKHHEQAVERMIAELQQSNKNLEQFAYVASHDLQEPLRKVIAFGDVLHKQFSKMLGEEGDNLVGRMQSAAGRMDTLIKGLLAFSRLSALKDPFRRISLQTIVSEIQSDLETTIREKQATVDVTPLPIVTGDPLQLQQLFQNLLTNALKFSKCDQSPHVQLTCDVVTGSAIHPLPGQSVAESDLDRQFYAIEITDNGIGFDEKYSTQIFTIFQRLHSRSHYQGTGIGLALVHKVVENHRGYVSVHSQPDKGATFVVYLPV